jgi:hypothetical protein
MFRCERCSRSYSPVHAIATENCPHRLARDGLAVPLTFKLSRLPPDLQSRSRRALPTAPEEGVLDSLADAGARPGPSAP